MPFWAIYETNTPGVGRLRSVVDQPPNLAALSEQGLGAAFFGEDAPDLSALEWCPRRLTFAARREGGAEVTELHDRLAAAEAALLRLSEPVAVEPPPVPEPVDLSPLLDRLAAAEEELRRLNEPAAVVPEPVRVGWLKRQIAALRDRLRRTE